jgi:hypothetical protein
VTYHVFHRTWWQRTPEGGRRPGVGHKTTIARVATEAEARALCHAYNASHDPGPHSRKAEYASEAPR